MGCREETNNSFSLSDGDGTLSWDFAMMPVDSPFPDMLIKCWMHPHSMPDNSGFYAAPGIISGKNKIIVYRYLVRVHVQIATSVNEVKAILLSLQTLFWS